jgi:molybdenum cofactor biosynthesis protein A
MIKDNFGRKHTYLRISLTEKCNLRCTYCMPEEGIPLRPHKHFMTTDEVFSIASTFVKMGVKKIRLTGGEPMVHKNFEEILLKLSELPIELTLTTNAVLLDKYINALLQANIKSINISLDTLNPERFLSITRRDNFEKVMSNIELAITSGIKVKLNAVLMNGVNDDEVYDFVELTKEKNISMRFIEFMPFDGNNWNWSKKVSEKQILETLIDKYGTNQITKIQDQPNDTSHNYRIKNYKGTFGIISTVTNPFCDTCNRIRLTADGKIKNCLFSNDEADLLTAFRNGQPIEDLIVSAIKRKHPSRAGLQFDDESIKLVYSNRSMIAIGG